MEDSCITSQPHTHHRKTGSSSNNAQPGTRLGGSHGAKCLNSHAKCLNCHAKCLNSHLMTCTSISMQDPHLSVVGVKFCRPLQSTRETKERLAWEGASCVPQVLQVYRNPCNTKCSKILSPPNTSKTEIQIAGLTCARGHVDAVALSRRDTESELNVQGVPWNPVAVLRRGMAPSLLQHEAQEHHYKLYSPGQAAGASSTSHSVLLFWHVRASVLEEYDHDLQPLYLHYGSADTSAPMPQPLRTGRTGCWKCKPIFRSMPNAWHGLPHQQSVPPTMLWLKCRVQYYWSPSLWRVWMLVCPSCVHPGHQVCMGQT